MLTAILAEASEKPSETGLFSYAIVYTDGVSMKYVKRYTADALTDELIQQVATAELNRLNKTISAKRTIAPGVEITVLSATEITPEQQAERDFLSAVRNLRGLRSALELGCLAPDDKELSVAQELVKTLWRPEFLALI